MFKICTNFFPIVWTFKSYQYAKWNHYQSLYKWRNRIKIKLKSKWGSWFGVYIWIQGHAYRHKYLFYLSKPKNTTGCMCSLIGQANKWASIKRSWTMKGLLSFYNTNTYICTHLIAQTKITGSISLLKLHLVIQVNTE